MSLHLVTGHKGEAHITAEDQGAFNAAIFGDVDAILSVGEKCKASAITANTVRISDGEIIMHGRHVRIARGTYVDVPIENGTQGMNRNDLIVVRYTKEADLGYENAEIVALKGTETTGTATDPTPTTGDILSESCLLHEMPLYRVKLTGITVAAVELLVDTIETIPEYRGTSLSVSKGGTGKKTHTSNSVLVGNGTSALKNIASKIGAFFSRGADTEPEFGTLPIECGGTGATTASEARRNLGAASTSHSHANIQSAGGTKVEATIDKTVSPYVSYLIPDTQYKYYIGSADAKWEQLYAVKSSINTSDKNMKKNIEELDERYIQLFDLIRPVSYQLIDGDRIHTGFVAQEIEDAMAQVGLSAEELGFFCKDIKTKPVFDEEGEVIGRETVCDEDGNPMYTYGLRHEELISIIVAKFKLMEKQIDTLQKEIAALKA